MHIGNILLIRLSLIPLLKSTSSHSTNCGSLYTITMRVFYGTKDNIVYFIILNQKYYLMNKFMDNSVLYFRGVSYSQGKISC